MFQKKIHILLLSFVCCVAVCFSGCSQSARIEEQYVQVVEEEVEWVSMADTPEEMPLVSDLVVLFVPETQENKLGYFPGYFEFNGYTLTTGCVTKVLQGNIVENSQLQVTEVCYVYNEGTELRTIDGYLPMQQGGEYLLFLKAYEEDSAFAGMYSIVDMNYGKYIVGSRSIKDFEIASEVSTERYEKFFDGIRAMYPELF